MKPSTTLTRRPAGFSLIELVISLAITSVAIAATVSVIVTLSAMTRNAELFGEDADRARMAGTHLAKALESTGLMTPGGLRVNTATGPLLINPMFGIDGTTGAGFRTGGSKPAVTGPDDLWVVVPSPNAFRRGCVDQGAGVSVTRTVTSGLLTVQCPAAITSFATTDHLVAANTTTGALLSPPLVLAATTTATIGYKEEREAVAGYSPAPAPGEGFAKGDLVYGVTIYRYAIKLEPLTNRLALVRHRGITGTEATTNRPFVEDPAFEDEVVESFIEDLQISYGIETVVAGVTIITYRPSLPPEFDAATQLRSVRISVVAAGRMRDLSTSGDKVIPLTRLLVENHVPSTTPDGFRRALFTQRLELPNMAPGNL